MLWKTFGAYRVTRALGESPWEVWRGSRLVCAFETCRGAEEYAEAEDEAQRWRETFEQLPTDTGQLVIYQPELALPSEKALSREERLAVCEEQARLAGM